MIRSLFAKKQRLAGHKRRHFGYPVIALIGNIRRDANERLKEMFKDKQISDKEVKKKLTAGYPQNSIIF
jgi:hypothetical protein